MKKKIVLGFSVICFSWCWGSIALAVAEIPKSCGGYSFDHEPFISPRIIADLQAWISDKGEQVVSINLPESMETNRYYGDMEGEKRWKQDIYPTVTYKDEDECQKEGGCRSIPYEAYKLIGKSSHDIYVLKTESGGGGSGVFENLLFVTLTEGHGFGYDEKHHQVTNDRTRCLLTRLVEIPLGDRSVRDISMKGDRVLIVKSADGGNMQRPQSKDISYAIKVPAMIP